MIIFLLLLPLTIFAQTSQNCSVAGFVIDTDKAGTNVRKAPDIKAPVLGTFLVLS